MIEELKVLLGETASNYSEAQIGVCLKQAIREIEGYCARELDAELETVAIRVAIIKLNRLHSEGLASQSFSGISENYIDGYPQDILNILNRKRRIRVVG